MGQCIGLLLWLLLAMGSGWAQSTKLESELADFQKRMAALRPVQRFEPITRYASQLSEQSRFAEARPLLQAALVTARQKGLGSWEGQLSMKLGGLESILGNSTLAIDYFLQALVIFQKIHAYDLQLKACFDIRNEYAKLQNEAKSREYEQRAILLTRTHKPVNFLHLIHYIQVSRAGKRGSLGEEITYYQKCLNVLRANRMWANYYSYLDGYGRLLANAGRYQEAEQTFRQCLVYARRQGDRRREQYEYMHLPQPLLHLGRLAEAQSYAEMALSHIETDPERQDEHRTEVYSVLSQIAQARGAYKQALAYEQLGNQAAGRVQNAETSRQVAEVEAHFQVAQKQARIEGLAQDNQRQLDLIGRQAGGLLALLALLSVVLWQYRQIRRVNARLQMTNRTISENSHQISEQAERMGVLMRELHHRVKNNLAIVSSLLRMQSRRLTDPLAIQAVQDGQRRVEAMALIHQQFYQTDNPAEVGIKSYVTELTQGLLLGYGFDPDSFDCQIDVADLLLDVEVAVPLGLILNEVLTNAFKYAYADPTTTSDRPLRGRAGRVRPRPLLVVSLQPAANGGLLVEVQDNGPGLAEQPLPSGRKQSFGHRLIRELTGQLGGQMSLTNREGTYFRLWIPL